ncbi:hypothetical protein LMH87_004429 [Akanthomyces muscarius]|uniref:Uncharacterized protein n=1 Tax=Akanthomyces muscarius TaxID=2231603 RepID=A0A9W8Q6G5_AKAMU|nr:hypothetical protein LMH87_004429 [Akanthomyces muscarius]KAJ4145582.1 hypothetical protein LMH87_004429 [Akanthomyces muscarius]
MFSLSMRLASFGTHYQVNDAHSAPAGLNTICPVELLRSHLEIGAIHHLGECDQDVKSQTLQIWLARAGACLQRTPPTGCHSPVQIKIQPG